MTQLDDTVVLDPNVNPADVERALIDAVNLGWRQGGNDGRCNTPANFVGWALQEIGRLRSDLIERHRTLWLIVRSNGGYELDKHAIEEWPGDRAVLATRTDPATGNLVFAAYASADEQSQEPTK